MVDVVRGANHRRVEGTEVASLADRGTRTIFLQPELSQKLVIVARADQWYRLRHYERERDRGMTVFKRRVMGRRHTKE